MAKQVVLITGCSAGLGLDFAVTMAKDVDQRYIVYATMRNLAKKESLVQRAGDALNKTLFIKQLDVTKGDEIKKAVSEIYSEHNHIDILVNNAGFGQFNAFEEVPIEKVKALFDGNVFGAIQLCQEVMPKMKERKSGRIIFMGAAMGLIGYPFSEFYSAAKFALEGFAEAFAPIGRQFNIWVSTIEPGPVSTSFVANVKANAMGKFAGGIGNEADPATQKLAENMSMKMQGVLAKESQTPEEITKLLLEVVSSEKPHLRYSTSEHISAFYKGKYVDITGDGVIEKMGQLLS
ncbi:Retinol dehydrogenase 8 [Holothuria leucospilota]|uniref:Retinol dehydrogenase 8 n=1 Tax=Holothuria leucospilota TaxID=206669 RepID=A0A9Q0Y8Z5_HOLLE|nr:Retinol dehydrogenase 8 [Holothuria leucospilota]